MIHNTLVHRPETPSPTSPKLADAAIVMAGLANRNPNLMRRIGLPLGDPAAWVQLPASGTSPPSTIALVRDLEMDRVRAAGIAGRVVCPADFQSPDVPVDPDRETAVMMALAECLKRHEIRQVIADRSLPMIAAWHIAAAGLTLAYDDGLGVTDRRAKTPAELTALRNAQRVTESVMVEICRMIYTAEVDADGLLRHDGQTLTSESVRGMAARKFLSLGFTMTHGAIVAGPPDSGDCHHAGSGPLRTGVPIIVDLFPRDDSTRYHGDCTRTVVHGEIPPTVVAMHAAVVAAKTASEARLVTGNTAESVHHAAQQVLIDHGYRVSRGTITDEPSIQHGLGHGIGLEIHEPILLDDGGGAMLAGEVFTIEPGLYGRKTGGVRVEDMLVVTDEGPENFNELPVGLAWPLN